MNRYQMVSMRDGIAKTLGEETEALQKMYTDSGSTVDTRKTQGDKVKDLEERLAGIVKQIQAEDEKAAQKLETKASSDPEKALVAAKAAMYRSVIKKESLDAEKAALLDTPTSGGNNLLPKTVSDQVITTPMVTNPLREISTITNITNLEIPKLSFTLEDDEFVADGETAKEMAANADIITFGRYKFKVYVPVSETLLKCSDAELVALIEAAMMSALAKKEKRMALAPNPNETVKHMSFYAKTGNAYDIKAVSALDLHKAILASIADLEEDYREKASILMRYTDYVAIIKKLANGNASLYSAQPEQILGKPVVFCDLATIPVVGDFRYAHLNYDPDMLMDNAKDIKIGVELFVLTAWLDHRIKMRSAFRLAVVASAEPSSAPMGAPVGPSGTFTAEELEAKTAAELKEIARAKNVTGYGAMVKADLISAILAAN